MRDDDFKERVRSAIRISEVIGTRVTWDAKKSNPTKGDFWSPCPFHSENRPSFHCDDRKGFYHCFGCGVTGDMFKFVQELDNCTFPRAVETVAKLAGMAMPSSKPLTDEEKRKYAQAKAKREREAEQRKEQERRDTLRRVDTVRSIWKETLPFTDSLAHKYFQWRGITDPEDANLRFHPALHHKETDRLHPALVAKVQGVDGAGVGIWRIYLQPDGNGKLQGVDHAKLGLGPTAGGAVRLGGLATTIGLAEGIETARAVRHLGVNYPVWAGLSTSGIIGFQIPEGVDRVVIYPDRDRSKIKTKKDGRVSVSPGLNAAYAFIENNPGRDIQIADGPDDLDYLELLQKTMGLPIR